VVRKLEGRPGRRGVHWEGVDWIDLAQDRGKWRAVVNAVLNINAP
jgi:hypothetical protein